MAEAIEGRQFRRAPPIAGFKQTNFTLQPEGALRIGKIRLRPSVDLARLQSDTGWRPSPERSSYAWNDLTVSWLAPGEWLLTGEHSLVASALRVVGSAVGELGLALDISHGTSSFLLSGPQVRDALAGVSPLDLSDKAFGVGAVARTLLGEAVMFIARLPDAGEAACFRIIIDQTMAAYAVRMLTVPGFCSGNCK